MNKYFLFITMVFSWLSPSPLDYAKPTLSQFGFFKEPLNLQNPADGVIPYSVASSLFSDYAEKLRFIKVPNGQKLTTNSDGSFNYPKGSVLIKTFYYPDNFNEPEKNRRIIETRLLIKTKPDWVALPYVWNNEQTDAVLEIAGDRLPASARSGDGRGPAWCWPGGYSAGYGAAVGRAFGPGLRVGGHPASGQGACFRDQRETCLSR